MLLYEMKEHNYCMAIIYYSAFTLKFRNNLKNQFARLEFFNTNYIFLLVIIIFYKLLMHGILNDQRIYNSILMFILNVKLCNYCALLYIRMVDAN